ncbi:uncharacterized protein LOC143438209 [Arvicanthis niloticus]|uniref:uncharacterized protein LOC143438209 n=1 Tax=Arvicanthis niloticus TaxID=61156 RepID=UPI00403C986A
MGQAGITSSPRARQRPRTCDQRSLSFSTRSLSPNAFPAKPASRLWKEFTTENFLAWAGQRASSKEETEVSPGAAGSGEPGSPALCNCQAITLHPPLPQTCNCNNKPELIQREAIPAGSKSRVQVTWPARQ